MRIAKRPLTFALGGIAIVAMLVAALGFGLTRHQQVHAAGPQSQRVPLTVLGTSSIPTGSVGTDTSTQPDEIDVALNGDDNGNNAGGPNGGINHTLPGAKTGHGKAISAGANSKSNPVLGTNFDGLNFFNQRFANGGNQFSVEPPDQGMCAGNGFILESVNDVLRVFHTDGTPATGVADLNTFYGYAPAIIRTGPNAGQRGPSLTDPTCIYDQTIGRFINVVLTLDHVGKTAQESGKNHLDIAVSNTGDPTGNWTIYKLPVQNDGTDGTPDHQCGGPCFGDYPHIGADANGVFLTTNEFSFFGAGFFGSQIYGIGNNLLTGGTGGSVVLFDTLGFGPDGGGFTVWPAQTPGNQFDVTQGGTEYFLSSRAVFSNDGTSTDILQWTFSNTSSLNTASPAASLDVTDIVVDQYAVPPPATQKAGNHPLGDCIADLTTHCNTTIAGVRTHNGTNIGHLDANDSRMQQVTYANGKLWGALDTAVNVGGSDRAGIAYYILNPHSHAVDLQGQAGIANTDLTYPAIGVTQSGRGVVAFTLTGDNNYPSAGYAGIDDKVGMGNVQIAAAGVGAWDGFTGYLAFGNRPRWGDYGAAAVVGQDIWIASEYVAQTCTYATYQVDPTCGGTRGALGNWATHISKVTP